VVHELAQVNIARLSAPLESEQLADFVAALDEVNAEAEAAPGFRWRLADDSGNATGIPAFQWDVADSAGVIVNMSTWSSVEALRDYIYEGRHIEVLRRRREWFHKVADATTVLWWVPAGHEPTTKEAEERLRHVREHGPTPHAFTLRETFPPPVAS
jgi:hypothetical protein